MQKIIPHLWFDTQAKEAAKLYTSIFPDSHITQTTTLHDTPSGDTDIVSFDLTGFSFMAMNAGPAFTINPSISFMVNLDPSTDPQATTHINLLWENLAEGGKVLMPLQEYPFSKRYGWIQDRYGLSWQLILTNPEGDPRPFIVPSLLFTQQGAGKAEEAIRFYRSVFENSQMGTVARYGEGREPNTPEMVMFADFLLEDTWFAAMDSADDHKFVFNEAISFLVNCDSQEEIDYYWEKMSAVPEAEQCGWLKDKFGVSWQISPAAIHEK